MNSIKYISKTTLGVFLLCASFLSTINLTAQSTVLAKTQNKKIQKVVHLWSEAHDNWDLDLLRRLYSDSVVWYCSMLSEDRVLNKISGMLKPSDSFSHKIISDIFITQLVNGEFKCEFTKLVKKNGSTKSYPSYLVLQELNGKYYVAAESDEITDRNLNYNFEKNYLHSDVHNDDNKAEVSEAKGKSNSILIITVVACAALGASVIIFNRRRKSPNTSSKESAIKSKDDLVSKKEKTGISASARVNVFVNQQEVYKKKGDDFEKFIVAKFDREYFKLKDWRSDKTSAGVYPESNKYPDLEYEFRLRNYSNSFAVECKFRSDFFDDCVNVCKPDQLTNYREYAINKKQEVYIALGIGGEPCKPLSLYLIPLEDLHSTKIHKNELSKFFRPVNKDFFYKSDYHRLT